MVSGGSLIGVWFGVGVGLVLVYSHLVVSLGLIIDGNLRYE